MRVILKLPKGPALLLVILAVALQLAPQSFAQNPSSSCLYQCMGSTCADYGNHSDMCLEIRARCQAKCSQQSFWGAIAYSVKDGGYGWSTGLADVNEAKKQALQNCTKHGAACKVWIYYNRQCGAIAADGEKVGWGTSSSRLNAEQRAVQECQQGGGKKCAVQVSSCSE